VAFAKLLRVQLHIARHSTDCHHCKQVISFRDEVHTHHVENKTSNVEETTERRTCPKCRNTIHKIKTLASIHYIVDADFSKNAFDEKDLSVVTQMKEIGLLFAHLDYHTTHLVSAHVFAQFAERNAIRTMSNLKSALSKLKVKVSETTTTTKGMPTEKSFVMNLKTFTDLVRPALCAQVGIEDRIYHMPPANVSAVVSQEEQEQNDDDDDDDDDEKKKNTTQLKIDTPKTPPLPTSERPRTPPSSKIKFRTYLSPKSSFSMPRRRIPPPVAFPSGTKILYESRVGERKMNSSPSWSKRFLVLWSNGVLDTYKDANDESPHRRLNLEHDDANVFLGIHNRSSQIRNLLFREAEFLGGSLFTIAYGNESVHYLTPTEEERDAWVRNITRLISRKHPATSKLRRKSSTMLVTPASGLIRDYKDEEVKKEDLDDDRPRSLRALDLVRLSLSLFLSCVCMCVCVCVCLSLSLCLYLSHTHTNTHTHTHQRYNPEDG